MATHAPTTGARTRAPASDHRTVSSRAADLQTLLYRIDAIVFGLDAVVDEFGSVPDDYQRRLVGNVSDFAALIGMVTTEAAKVCETIEIDAQRSEREGR